MKRKKLIRKISRTGVALVLVIALVVSLFPFTNVFADDGYVLSFSVAGDHQMSVDNNHLVIDGQFVDLRDSSENAIGTVTCPSTTFCKITVDSNTPGYLNYYSDSKFSLYMQGHQFGFDQFFSANEDIIVQDYVEQQPGEQPGPDGPQFDGRAVVLWSCGSGVCYHKFSDIQSFDDGNSQFIPASSIPADNKSDTMFDVHAQYKEWYLTDTFDAWVAAYENLHGTINWETLDPELMLGDPIDMREYEEAAINAGVCTRPGQNASGDDWSAFQDCVDAYVYEEEGVMWTHELQPVGEPTENNAYVSYGDRNFKVVIYNDDYKGVTIGNLNELNYYPAEWANPYLRTDQYDISGTSADNPALISSVLLEKNLFIKELSANGFTIASIEAMDVPANAVSISKVNGYFRLAFSSNFYDNVLFKVTDTNEGVSYIRVNRFTVDAWINNVENQPHYYAVVYFDRNESFSDFDVTAKIEYKDGTTSDVVLEAYNKIDDGMGNITEFTDNEAWEVDEQTPGDPSVPAGKGLKKAVFIYKLPNGKTDRDIKRAYTYIEYKGSTATNYAGAFAGSGKGVLANIYQGE